MPGLSCERCLDLLGDYVDLELSPADRTEMNTHFLSCPQCRTLLESYRAVPELVRRATEVRIPRVLGARLRWLLQGRMDRH
jgi:anti-sigma factor RsiW